jgi:hypothetical protein
MGCERPKNQEFESDDRKRGQVFDMMWTGNQKGIFSFLGNFPFSWKPFRHCLTIKLGGFGHGRVSQVISLPALYYIPTCVGASAGDSTGLQRSFARFYICILFSCLLQAKERRGNLSTGLEYSLKGTDYFLPYWLGTRHCNLGPLAQALRSQYPN